MFDVRIFSSVQRWTCLVPRGERAARPLRSGERLSLGKQTDPKPLPPRANVEMQELAPSPLGLTSGRFRAH